MISLGIENFSQYLAQLRHDPEETPRLIERITIKVSRFYRNRFTFDALRREVLPQLARRAGPRPLKIWSAGCAFGEEAYTLAMLLDDLGRDDVVEATDLDPSALLNARAAVYPMEAVSELPEDLKERYLEFIHLRSGDFYRVRDTLRARVRFTQHDLTRSAEDALGDQRFDLICCRNVLIYLQRDEQERTFSRVRARLSEGGYLCLGEAEWPPAAEARTLSGLPRKTRVFRDLGGSASGEAA